MLQEEHHGRTCVDPSRVDKDPLPLHLLIEVEPLKTTYSGYALPHTGCPGSHLFIILGTMLTVLAAGGLAAGGSYG